MIPFINIRAQREAYLSEFKQAEQDVLDSGCFIGGPVVQALESELAEFTRAKHAITCGSGTDALTIALLALGLKPGDEVIVPDFTFIAPAECVMRLEYRKAHYAKDQGHYRGKPLWPVRPVCRNPGMRPRKQPLADRRLGTGVRGHAKRRPRLHVRGHFHHKLLPGQATRLLRGRRSALHRKR